MILAHDEIISERENGNIIIDPFILEHVGANSYDVRLGNNFIRVLENEYIDGIGYINQDKPQKFYKTTALLKGLLIMPGELWLGETIEVCGSDKYIPMIEGRSTFARMGLKVHLTAGFGDIGFKQKWTLELECTLPIVLYPGDRIAQVYFVQASSCNWLYGRDHKGHYSGQDGVTEAKI